MIARHGKQEAPFGRFRDDEFVEKRSESQHFYSLLTHCWESSEEDLLSIKNFMTDFLFNKTYHSDSSRSDRKSKI
jgi:hypothetical protein